MEKFFYILNIISDKAGKLILLASIVGTCYFSMKSFGASTPASALFYLLVCTLPLSLFSAGLFIRIYLPGIAERIAYGFFGGRSYLSKAPLVLSPLWGDLKNGDHKAALAKAELLLEKEPFHGELLYIYSTAALSLPEEKEKAIFHLEKFFFMESPSTNWHLKLLFLYLDHAEEFRKEHEIIPLLQKEVLRKGYKGQEKEAIRLRLNAFSSGK